MHDTSRAERRFYVVGLVTALIVGASAARVALAGERDRLLITDFRSLDPWRSGRIRVASGQYGFEPARDGRPARMWYHGTTGFRDTPHWYWFRVNEFVAPFDFIEIVCKLGNGVRLTTGIWFDGKQVVPRPFNYITGTGDWQTLRIKVLGTRLTTIALSMSEAALDLGEDKIYEAFFREIRAVREDAHPTALEARLPDVIVAPTPKEIAFTGEKLPLRDGDVALLVSDARSAPESTGAEELAAALAQLWRAHSRLPIVSESRGLPTQRVVFALGTTLSLFRRFGVSAPPKQEGYAIACATRGRQSIVLLAGRDPTGAYWAVQTALQLLRNERSGPYFAACKVRDWPTYAFRGISCPTTGIYSDQAVRYKINVLVSLHSSYRDLYDRWDDPGERYRNSISALTDFAVRREIRLYQTVCPFWVKGWQKGGAKTFRCSSDEDMEKLYQTYRLSLERGGRLIGFFCNDPGAGPLHADDQRFFAGDRGKAHAYAARRLYEKVKQDFPDAELAFLPHNPAYAGVPTLDNPYFKALRDGMPKDVIFVWTGPSTFSFQYTDAQLQAYRKAIGGRRFVIFDNTPGYRHGTRRPYRMFDTYADGFGPLWKRAYGLEVMTRFDKASEITNIDAIVAAEYLWNAEAYRPAEALAKVLALKAGRHAIAPILAFRRAYCFIADKYPVTKSPSALRDAEKKTYAIDPATYASVISPAIGELSRAIAEIKQRCANPKLTAELERKHKRLVEGIAVLREHGAARNRGGNKDERKTGP